MNLVRDQTQKKMKERKKEQIEEEKKNWKSKMKSINK